MPKLVPTSAATNENASENFTNALDSENQKTGSSPPNMLKNMSTKEQLSDQQKHEGVSGNFKGDSKYPNRNLEV